MKIQPQELAISGKPMVSRPIRQYQRDRAGERALFLVSIRCGGSSSAVRRSSASQNLRRVSQSPARPTAKEVMPKPIIQRKPQ